MIKLFISILLIFSNMVFAQKIEPKINMISAIALGKIDVAIEYFVENKQSVELGIIINDEFLLTSNDTKYTSILMNYNFYFGDHFDKLYVFPQLKLKTGKYNTSSTEDYANLHDKSFSVLGIGLGSGYKFVHDANLTVSGFVYMNRSFNDTFNSVFLPIEINGGISMGYRF